MSYKIDGVEPTSITLDGVDLTDVTIDGVGVWGKPYTLHYETNSTYTISVTRIESKYQGASLGALSSGSVIYYGDVLTIIIARVAGYYISSTTINGETETHSNTISIERNWDVNGSLTISATTIAIASWHEVFTGTSSAVFMTASSLSSQKFSPSLTIPNNSTKIRASYTLGGTLSGTGTTEISLSSGNGKSSNLSTNTSKVPELYIKCESYSVKAEGRNKNLSMFNIKVTKLEAYY